jgi:hypothetical protein
MGIIRYIKGSYKYQLRVDEDDPSTVESPWGHTCHKHVVNFSFTETSIDTPYLSLINEGLTTALYIRDGYAWDGASGPTLDTRNSMRASLVHDSLWQLIAAGELGEGYRASADKEFHSILKEDGMDRFRAKLWYWAVSKLGRKWVQTFGRKPKLLVAPKPNN